MAITTMEPVGPWKCTTCGRDLLLIVDPSVPSEANESIRDQCGTEHFVPGHLLGFFFRTQDGNWISVPQPQADEDAHVKGEVREERNTGVLHRPKVA